MNDIRPFFLAGLLGASTIISANYANSDAAVVHLHPRGCEKDGSRVTIS